MRTAQLRPGHDAEFAGSASDGNHRWEQPVDVAHATYYRSVERVEQLKVLVAERATADDLAHQLPSPPLDVSDYAGGFGTLYTADYRPAERRSSTAGPTAPGRAPSTHPVTPWTFSCTTPENGSPAPPQDSLDHSATTSSTP